jgi:hypothetical protein
MRQWGGGAIYNDFFQTKSIKSFIFKQDRPRFGNKNE